MAKSWATEKHLLSLQENIGTQMMMNNSSVLDPLFPNCPIRNILARISDKWSLLVIYHLNQSADPLRFKQLQRSIPDVSQKMLTSTLRALQEDGYVTRTVYPEVPPRVEYALTERAKSLIPHINGLLNWALEHMADIIHDREKNRRLSPKDNN